MPGRDEDYVQKSPGNSDVEMDLDYETGPSRISAKDKGKGRAGAKDKGKGVAGKKEVYSWEESYTRSWDAIQEDEEGSLLPAVGDILARNRRRRLQKPAEAIRRAIIRHLILILDLSSAMTDRDMRPNRFDLTLEYSREFIAEWFDQNPLGQVGIVGMREGVAERICGLSGNPPDVLKTLADRRKLEPSGDASLQNAIDMAMGGMGHLPSHSSREILIIFGSLTTCDPGNIHDTLKNCIQEGIRVSVVALAAEMKVCKNFCDETGGVFGVALNEGHFRDMFFEQIPPPAVRKEESASAQANGNGISKGAAVSAAELVMMGFPTRLPANSLPTLCACHGIMKSEGYLCPRCLSKVCDIPTDCNVCDLMIVSAPHLARSYHHLFPVKAYEPIMEIRLNEKLVPICQGCGTSFPSTAQPNLNVTPGDGMSRYGRYRCPECKKDFCSDCDIFVHDVLHVCPACDT